MMLYIAYVMLALLFIFMLYVFLKGFEHTVAFRRSQIPFVASSRHLRNAVVDAINRYYPNAKTVCEIGGGYGGLARRIARECGVCVVSLENLPFTYGVARACDFLSRANSRTIYADAFEYLKHAEKFDIGIAYLGPTVNPELKKFQKKFNVMITLDVPIDGFKVSRIIDVGHGNTTYGYVHRHKYPHKLFIYEF